MHRLLIAVCFASLLGDAALAQNAALIPVRRPSPTSTKSLSALEQPTSPSQLATAGELQSVDATTAWAFRALETVVLSTPIVRLEDIVKPLSPNLAAWPRLRRVAVGLLPSDGTAMTIQRDRLSHSITTMEATPRQIQWFGPEEITVRFDAELAKNAAVISARDAVIATASHKQPVDEVNVTQQTSYTADSPVSDEAIVVDQITRDRIRNWIEMAIRRELRDVAAEYEIELVDDRQSTAALAVASSLASIELIDVPAAGRVSLRVVGRHQDGPVVVDVPLMLTEHRKVVMGNMNLQRGERIGVTDVRLAPLPAKLWKDSYATSLDAVLGLEVHGIVRENAPLSLSDVGPPILIHRGDLLEVRVIGGGVMITTNAKSIGEGAAGELVEVETIEPRRRLIAKVVSTGLAEIITRAPQVRQ